MKERPILFSGPMVTAILEGRKTQTRRVVKFRDVPLEPEHHNVWRTGDDWQDGDDTLTCPYGRPGDRLWVRETFASPVASWTDYGWEWDEDDGARLPGGKPVPGNQFSKRTAKYRADYGDWHQDEGPWRPPIHMPRWASRLTLEVTGVRVERLQSLSEEDAEAEGVAPEVRAHAGISHIVTYRRLWDRINAARGHSWESNPWVWVIEFQRVEAPSDALRSTTVPDASTTSGETEGEA